MTNIPNTANTIARLKTLYPSSPLLDRPTCPARPVEVLIRGLGAMEELEVLILARLRRDLGHRFGEARLMKNYSGYCRDGWRTAVASEAEMDWLRALVEVHVSDVGHDPRFVEVAAA